MTDSPSDSSNQPKIAVESGSETSPAKVVAGTAAATTPDAERDARSYSKGRAFGAVLGLLSAALFIVGIFAPSFTMIPKLGDGYFERFVRLFMRDELAPRTFSLVGGVWRLLRDGDFLVGGVILIFSVIFPAAKLVALAVSWLAEQGSAERHLGVLEQLGKWSMLDVFVIAALVACFKGFPGGSHVQIEWGIYVFAASVVLSMLATRSMKQWHGGGHGIES
jgi:paraquat-inducible protein A